MRSNSASVFLAVLLTIVIGTSLAYSHHATATEYDIARTVVLRGTISRLEWANPHVRVLMMVTPDSGVSEEWDVEFGSPGAMAVTGILKDDMKPGGVITIKGYPAKQVASPGKPKRACALEATLSDGLKATFVVGI